MGNDQEVHSQTSLQRIPELNQSLPGHMWEEEPAKFICNLCKKTFYNLTALNNHKNMTHDHINLSSEAEVNWNSSVKLEENVSGFKFIPLANTGHALTEDHPVGNDFKTRMFTQDTSYLIVKVEGDEYDNTDNIKKTRLDGITRKKSLKLPVDLRGPFTCTLPSTLRPDLQCRQIFYNCCDYSLHYREEHTKRRKAALRCQVCEKRLDCDFSGNNNAMPRQYHTIPVFTFSCRLCGLRFLDSSRFDEHNRIAHAKMKPHQCPICSKRFTQQGGLQQHMRMHTGIRPFACSFCPKSFTQKAGLDQHLRTHTKVKPFKCVICSKCFSQSVHLRQHMRTHTNIQPFECSVCGRRFKQSSHLNFHLRSHVNDFSALVVERYAQVVEQQDQMEYFNLANLQQVQDGETLYYSAQLAAEPSPKVNQFVYQSQYSQSILS